MRKKKSMTLAPCFLREAQAKTARERGAEKGEKSRGESSRNDPLASHIMAQAKKRTCW
jgi:hypothetical protein